LLCRRRPGQRQWRRASSHRGGFPARPYPDPLQSLVRSYR
jgi:hypothetical protein